MAHLARSRMCHPRLRQILTFHSHGRRGLTLPFPRGTVLEEMDLVTLFTLSYISLFHQRRGISHFRNELGRKSLSWCSSNQLECTFLHSLPMNINSLLCPKVKIVSGQALPRKERNPEFNVRRLIQLGEKQKSWFCLQVEAGCSNSALLVMKLLGWPFFILIFPLVLNKEKYEWHFKPLHQSVLLSSLNQSKIIPISQDLAQ